MTMKLITCATLLVFSCMLSTVHSRNENIWQSKALMAVSWTTVDSVPQPSVSELYKFENAAAFFLLEMVHEDDHQIHLLDTSVAVQRHVHERDTDNSHYLIQSLIEVEYIDHYPIPSLATKLGDRVLGKSGAQLLGLLKDISVIPQDVDALQFGFSNITDPDRVVYALPDEGRTASEKSLIVVVTFLVLALIAVSSVLLWYSGGCVHLKSAVPYFVDNGFKIPYGVGSLFSEKDNSADDTVTTASGILGALPSYDMSENGRNKNGKSRGVLSTNIEEEDSVYSPLSQNTNATNTQGVTLGIVSMRKLNRFPTPKGGDEGEEENVSFGFSKQLPYQL